MKHSRILALALAIVMLFAFAACTKAPVQEEPSTEAPTTENATDVAAPEGAPEIKDSTDKVTFSDFSFIVNGKEITNDDLKDCSIYKITVETVNSKGNTKEATYGGYAIKDVLKAAGCEDATKISVICNDGHESETPYEITAENAPYILLAIEKNKEVGEDGTVWFAPCLEETSEFYAKLVTELVAE